MKSTGASAVRAIDLLLPFEVEEGLKGDQFRGCMDLYDTLFHPETSELIFGEPVNISGSAPSQTLALTSGEVFRPRRIDTARVKALSDEPPRSSSYSVPLIDSLVTGDSAYVRLRFRVFANRPLLTARSAFGGVILDFRIADVRESRNRSKEASFRPRIVPIGSVNFFAMLPDQYQMLTASSQPRNMRILETRAWSHYLNRAAYKHPSNTQLVYYWRSADNFVVSPDAPFRVFATYERHLKKARVFFWSFVALLILGGLIRAEWIPGVTADSIQAVMKPLFTFLGLLTLAGIISAAKIAFNFMMSRFARVRLVIRWAERLMLGRRLGP